MHPRWLSKLPSCGFVLRLRTYVNRQSKAGGPPTTPSKHNMHPIILVAHSFPRPPPETFIRLKFKSQGTHLTYPTDGVHVQPQPKATPHGFFLSRAQLLLLPTHGDASHTFSVPASRPTESASSSALPSRPSPGVTRNSDLLEIHSYSWHKPTKLSMAALPKSMTGDNISGACIACATPVV